MQEVLTGDDVFSEILLLRGSTDKAILVVEGPSDFRTFELHIDDESVELVVGHDRPRVEKAIEIADSRAISEVVGVIDADLDRFFGNDPDGVSPNLVSTEHYDLEADLFFHSDVADRLIRAYASVSSLKGGPGGCNPGRPSELIVRLCLVIGALRLISRLHSYELMLRELALGACIDRKSATYRTDALAALIKSKSKATSKSELAIQVLLEACVASGWNDVRSCCGHDMVTLTAAALDSWWGNRVSKENVYNALRLAVNSDKFREMKIGRSLTAWANSNNVAFWRAA